MTPLRVLVCEDSRTYAAALRRMLEYDGDIAVDAVCATAEEAVAALPRIEPGLLTMDLELPGMDGLEAVGEIMSFRPLPILVLSAHVGPRSDKAAAALAAGAIDALAKDDLDLRDPAGAAGAAFRQRVRALSRARVIRHPRARLGARPARPARPGALRLPRYASVIGVCASAGGPQMLVLLLGALPADYPIPLLIVQHMAAGFTGGLVRWLDQTVAMPVGVAEPGAQAAPGAWLAPEGAHLTLNASGRLALDRHTVAGHHRPSGDVLLSSIAAAAGQAGAAVVLSGMGTDGAAGAAAVRRRGGLVIAQDEQSSAVFGMPKAAIDLGVDAVLSPDEIVDRLRGLRHEPLPGTH
ncbi:MAG: chemotaxis protein CheB [Streptosporangiaceae bacterium]|jgi:two-component system chemotaxis response regulator CheB